MGEAQEREYEEKILNTCRERLGNNGYKRNS
jgi:hypothetical protein